MQSRSPNTEVLCTQCVGASNALTNGKTVGYTSPIATFAGRFLDSQATNDIQYPIRTLRAGKMIISPDGRRIYMIMGGVAMAYDAASFISRLTAGEALIPVTSIPVNVQNYRPGAPEVFLRADRYFNAEWGGGWTTPFVDGQARLNDIDIDDQGYLYVSHFVFGWGIVKDDLRTDGGMTLMSSQYQHYPYGDSGDQDPIRLLSFKSGSNYFLLVNASTQMEIWNVTDRTAPRRVQVMRTNFSQAAKNAAGDRIAITDSSTGGVNIYSAESLSVGGAPMATFSPGFPFTFASVTTDGVNFFASFTKPTLKVEVFSPVGATFGDMGAFDTGLSSVNAAAIRVSNGYLTMITADGVLLYKVTSNLSFTEIPLKSSYGRTNASDPNSDRYFPQYYFNAAPPGYGYPHFYVHASDAGVIKSGAKSYLIFLGGGLGDVYEIQNGDGIALATLGSTGTQNLNTPATERSKLIYGDPVGFTASTTAPVPMNITWNFGNAEAVSGADANTVAGQTGAGTVTHRYSGIASAGALTTRTVQASNSTDSSVFATVPVTMLAPVPRVGLTGFGTLFTQTTATSSAPVVVGDQWYDASDGSVEGHKSSWSLYNSAGPTTTPVVTPLTPAQKLDAGQCGPHYVLFTGHYGQLATSFPASDFIVPSGGLGIGYNVRPFAANVTVSASGSNLVFTNATKLSTDTTVLTAAILAGLQFKWELFSASGSLSQAGPAGAYSAITAWTLPSTSISRGMTVRLTLTSPTDFTGACAGLGYTTSAYTTPPLNAPDPVINGTCTAAPCTFTAGSLSGVNPVTDGWTFAWNVSGTNLTGGNQTFSPSFPSSGTYTVNLTATNSFGSAPATPKQVSPIVNVCAPYTPNVDVFISYGANTSGCTTGQPCQPNEVVFFNVSAPFYSLACGPHTYAWSFGDGATGSGLSPTHSYGSAGTNTVTCVVTDSSTGTQQTLTRAITLANGGGGCVTNCGGNGGNTDPCTPGMSSANVFATFANNAGTCSGTGGTCGVGETISFTAGSFGYNYSCDSHTFFWNFGDGTTGSGITTTHAYAGANTYTVTLTISRPSKGTQFQANPVSVKVGSNNPLGCQPPMAAGTNVFIVYSNAASTCSGTGGVCAPNEPISFQAGSFNYDYNCASHSFSWSYGDGNTGSGKSVSHTYASPGNYTVSLTIANNGQTVTTAAQVQVGSGVTPLNGIDFTITPWFANGVPIPNGYKFTPGSDPAGVVTKYAWNFEDGTCPAAGDAACTSTAEIYHVFPTSANYHITLSIKTPTGHEGVTAVHPLEVVPSRRRSVPHT